MPELLDDILQQLLLEPHQVMLWQNLFQELMHSPHGEVKLALCQQLHDRHFEDVYAELLRLGFLHDVMGGSHYQQRMADLLLAPAVRNPDRLIHFITYVWGVSVKKQADITAFTHVFQQIGFARLVAKLADQTAELLPQSLVARAAQKVQKVAIVAPFLADGLHTPSSMVVNQCNLLVAEGKTVQVFSAQELQVALPERFAPSDQHVPFSPPDIDFWRQALPAGVSMIASDTRFSLKGRWQTMLQHIADFDPDVVYLCGLYSPLAAALYTRRPVLALNVHVIPSVSPADVWLSAEEQAPTSSPWAPVYPLPVTRFHPYRIMRQSVASTLSRLDLALDSDALVWVSVGFRLGGEIAGEWAERCAQLIRQQPQIVWVLVGIDTVPLALQQLPADNIRVLGGRKDVSAVLQLADIYVNPPRMGGGYSVAEAMAEALPVVSLADSDGGRKLGSYAVSDETAYFALLVALSADKTLREQGGAAMQQRFASQLDLAAAGPHLSAALDQTVRIAAQRLVNGTV